MDCSFADQQQQQQPQQLQKQQQQQHNSINCLDESIKNLTNLGSSTNPTTTKSHTSPLKCVENSAAAATAQSASAAVKLRKYSERSLTSSGGDTKSHTYRISMANLEETQESELDVILGELSLLEAQINCGDAAFLPGHGLGAAATTGGAPSINLTPGGGTVPPTRTHSRTNSTISGATTLSISGCSESAASSISENGGGGGSSGGAISSSSGSSAGSSIREPRTESPDNDSAFSDTVSLLSSESSASSSASSAHHHKQQQQLQQQQQLLQLHYMQQQLSAANAASTTAMTTLNSSKAAKIQLALHKLEHASIRRLFVKAFTADGASKSLLVDERMTCGHVTRLLADKNHVQMQPHWALVENLGDLQMERLFEDHELLVDNLMTWNSDAGNRVLFQQRTDKVALFIKPEIYLPGTQMAPGSQHDEHTRTMLLEEFFETNSQLQVDGPLYMKADSKKGWKRYHFVLRSSGLYYFPKEKTKSTRDLACLTLFNGNNVYRGLGWRKKWKAPTDYTFGFKSAVDSSLGKSCRTLKMLCAEDLETMEKWVTAIRISKYGKQLWADHKTLMEDLSGGGGGSAGGGGSDTISNSSFAVSMRSESISSISSAVPSHCGSVSSAISSMSSNSSSGRASRASSSSSSGCLSDDNNGFDSEFTTGTIKRKPSMKPNLPLTTMTRQLKEVGEITICESGSVDATDCSATSPERSGTLTRRHSRRKSQESNNSSCGGGNSGTLKRRQPSASAPLNKRNGGGSAESMNAASATHSHSSGGSSNSTPTPTPSICAKPLLEYAPSVGCAPNEQPPVTQLPNCMTSSTLSLDSLPPPPPPPPLLAAEHEMYGSQLSLASLPPPPPPEEVAVAYKQAPLPPPQMMQPLAASTPPHAMHFNYNIKTNGAVIGIGAASLPPAVPAKPIKPAVKAAPPYKAPPEYVGQALHLPQQQQQQHYQAQPQLPPPAAATTTHTGTTTKKVSFADSPVLLRRKMCSPEPPRSPSMVTPTHSLPQHFYALAPSPAPLPPPRADLTRLSAASSSSAASFGSAGSAQDFGSPKRLHESTSNPPRDFLKDLQRVMRKKWQVAQKCKLEPATTPHEVLGFRDFSDELLAHNLNAAAAGNSSHYYRETANVSNWVQEHYGAGAPTPPAPLLNEYALYENLGSGGGGVSGNGAAGVAVDALALALTEPQFPVGGASGVVAQAPPPSLLRKKRPPPPPPKRSDSTHLTHRV